MVKRRVQRMHPLASDANVSVPLQIEVAALRGDMLDAAERSALPSRFVVEPSQTMPAMIIVDRTTGRRTEVGLYAYGAVREALNDLFAERQ